MSQIRDRPDDGPSGPYKYLEPYDLQDRELFYGRELEVERLLSDVVVNHLVVLFAKTGTGKTSLINAGVRPRLHEFEFCTAYMRVETDPITAAREALAEEGLLPRDWEDPSWVAQLKQVVRERDQEIVLFFDQFEEFFNNVPRGEQRTRFISDIADIYNDPDAGIHVVFSMREEYWHEMDDFREQIPSIFAKGSSLRLRLFNKKQARDAIVRPAEKFGVSIEEPLVDHLLDDLASDGEIEPLQLQIVCDTLWQQRTNGQIRLATYIARGGTEGILGRRLQDDIKRLDPAFLPLFERLLPELSTRKGTKLPQPVEGLVSTLKLESSDALDPLVEALQRLRLLKEYRRDDLVYVEWTSDYLAENERRLADHARARLLRQLLHAALIAAAARRAELAQKARAPLTEQAIQDLYLPAADFQALSEGMALLEDLSDQELKLMLDAALEHRSAMRDWFDKARAYGTDVWGILETKITDEAVRDEQAANAIRLLGELSAEHEQAIELLEGTLQRGDLARLTIQVLGETKSEAAARLLETGLQQGIAESQIIDVLRRMRTADAIDVLEAALEQPHLAIEARRALERVSRKEDRAAVQARDALARHEPQEQTKPPATPSRTPTTVEQPSYWEKSRIVEADWRSLLRRIRDGKCTPFIGAGASYPALPLESTIAQAWAKEYDYPLEDKEDLVRVAQFLAIKNDPLYPKEEFLRQYVRGAEPPDFFEPDEPHGLLADLPLPIYVTTTYDDFMVRALESRGKTPQRELLPWNKYIGEHESVFDAESDFEPTPERPVVFHLLGHDDETDSLVLAEGDYMDFLVNVSRAPELIPARIQRALASTSLLFIGYSPGDWSFRVVLRGIVQSTASSLRRISMTVLAPPRESSDLDSHRRQEYLDQYATKSDLQVYWGTPRAFAAELRRRWEAFCNE